MQPTHKQSAATNRHIINAVSVLGPTAKPREILEFLHDKKQAKYVTAKILRGRLCRLKQAGRVSLENGSRNADEMESWRMDIGTIVRGQSRQLGVRGVFYLAVAAGLCAKTNQAYQSVVAVLDILRMSGEVPFDHIIDAGRTIHPYGLDERSPVADLITSMADYDAIRDNIEATVTEEAEQEPWIYPPKPPQYYQAQEPDELTERLMGSDVTQAQLEHGQWDGCEEVPFVLCEKEGLAGIIEPVCAQYHVPFVAVRGAASITILHDIWELLQESNLQWRFLTFYDWDKAGMDIEAAAMDRLRAFGGEADWTSQRVAVTEDQIETLDLPMRPEKRGYGEAVELDAIPPDTLAEIVENAIKACIPDDIDAQRIVAREEAEAAHRERVTDIVDDALQDYEPQRNTEMERYVEDAKPQFDALRDKFLRDAPE